MLLNSDLCFHGLVPAETFHEAELITCVCVEAISIKKRAEINMRTFWANRKLTRWLQKKTEIQFAKDNTSKWLPTDQTSHLL